MTRFAFAFVLLAPLAAGAGEFNKVLKVGDPAPAWTELMGTDGRAHSLDEWKDRDVVVVVFTCNSCPVAAEYEDRIIAFAKSALKTVAVVAINVNTKPDDRLDKMKERAAEKNFPFAYLYDPSQKIGRAYGAEYTPEFYVLDRQRKIAYMGAMDDKNSPKDATKSYLTDAVTAVLAGKTPAPAETLARGCRVAYTRPR